MFSVCVSVSVLCVYVCIHVHVCVCVCKFVSTTQSTFFGRFLEKEMSTHDIKQSLSHGLLGINKRYTA